MGKVGRGEQQNPKLKKNIWNPQSDAFKTTTNILAASSCKCRETITGLGDFKGSLRAVDLFFNQTQEWPFFSMKLQPGFLISKPPVPLRLTTP